MSKLRCYTCLQLDRKLCPLKAQVKFLFAWLCPEMFTKTADTAQYFICWECESMADKIKKFQTKLKKSNKILQMSFKGKTTIIEGLSCLKLTAIETISLTLPKNPPIPPQNVPTLPLNVPMLPKIVPSLPQNIQELSLKDMLVIPTQLDSQAEVKMEEEASKDFDELIQTTTILQVPFVESDPLLIPGLNQPVEIEVPPQELVKPEIIEPAIKYVLQKVFINPPKDQVKLRGFREDVKVTVRDPNLAADAEINPVLLHKDPEKSKNSDNLLTKLLSTPLKSGDFFLMRQPFSISDPQEPECSESSGIDRERVPNTNPPKESESSEQSSGDAYEDKTRLIILNRTQLNEMRNKKRQKNAYKATSYKCETCVEWFLSQEKLNKHNLKHDVSRGNLICEICEQRFADNSALNIHHGHHFILYECNKCQRRYTNRAQLSTHYVKTHEESWFVCKKCFASFKTYKERSAHVMKTHIERKSCEECGKIFPNDKQLKAHVLNIHKSKPIECPVCKKVVKKFSLKTHMKMHDGKSEYGGYCVDCGTTYKSKYVYELHLKNSLKHNSIEKLGFKCDHCDKYFSNKVSLRNHTEEIAGAKYTCDICKKDSKTKRILITHIQIVHEGKKPKVKPVVCEVCGKYFKKGQKGLREHLNTHRGIRPFVCKDCGATFSYSAALFTHRRLKHKVKRKYEMTT